MFNDSISTAALRRLPLYLQYLLEIRPGKHEFVSAARMATALGIHHTLVRQDLDVVGAKGFPKKGHPLEETIAAIETYFQWNSRPSAFILGAGNLARVLIGYRQFDRAGVDLLAAFDQDSRKVGTSIFGIEVLSVTKFVDLVRRMHVAIVILTLPPSAAEESVKLITESGVAAVWNFMPATLQFPDRVVVENVNLFAGLSILKKKLTESLNRKEPANEHGNGST
jgi:redox-sensing transcriptional repressor